MASEGKIQAHTFHRLAYTYQTMQGEKKEKVIQYLLDFNTLTLKLEHHQL